MKKKQKRVFKRLKKKFTKKLMLVILDLDKKIRMKVNTLNYTTKEMLLMKCKNRR